MRLGLKKEASFSTRMLPAERDILDDIAIAHDRPRSWVIRKFVTMFAHLEKAQADGSLNPGEAAALAMLKKGLAEPTSPYEADDE